MKHKEVSRPKLLARRKDLLLRLLKKKKKRNGFTLSEAAVLLRPLKFGNPIGYRSFLSHIEKDPRFRGVHFPMEPKSCWDEFEEEDGYRYLLGKSYKGFTRSWNKKHKKKYRPFKTARAFARSLKLSGPRAWKAYSSGKLADIHGLRPEDIPSHPENNYPEFTDYFDWCGAKRLSKKILSYRKGKETVAPIKFTSARMFLRWLKGELKNFPSVPKGFPKNPDVTWKGRGWKNYFTFLDLPKREYFVVKHLPKTMEQFITEIRSRGIRNEIEYDVYRKRYKERLQRKEKIYFPPRKKLLKFFPNLPPWEMICAGPYGAALKQQQLVRQIEHEMLAQQKQATAQSA